LVGGMKPNLRFFRVRRSFVSQPASVYCFVLFCIVLYCFILFCTEFGHPNIRASPVTIATI
jgi:hypothetical protein